MGGGGCTLPPGAQRHRTVSTGRGERRVIRSCRNFEEIAGQSDSCGWRAGACLKAVFECV